MKDFDLKKLVNIIGVEKVEELVGNFGLVIELLYGEDDELNIYLPFKEDELGYAEEKINKYLQLKLNFEENYEEQDFLDTCKRLVKTYENNEILEIKFFLKVLSGVSGYIDIDLFKYLID